MGLSGKPQHSPYSAYTEHGDVYRSFPSLLLTTQEMRSSSPFTPGTPPWHLPSLSLGFAARLFSTVHEKRQPLTMTAFLCPCSAQQPASSSKELQLDCPLGGQKGPSNTLCCEETLFLKSDALANKQSSSETTKPGWSFSLPPDSCFHFILGAGLKQRGPGVPLPTATGSCLAPEAPLPSPGLLQLCFPHAWCLSIIAGHGLSPPQQPKSDPRNNRYLGSGSTCLHGATVCHAAGDISASPPSSSDHCILEGDQSPPGL